MDFLFFSATGQPYFTRNDAESAQYCHEEMSFQATFPYDPEKVILRGMRVGYFSSSGEYRACEVRKANTLEPEHCQEITAEHIAISELTDEVVQKKKYTNVTAQSVLAELLTGTLWSVGTVTATNTSSADIENGYAWSAVRAIEKNWNVYITPRLTVSSAGITGRYLDIAPYGGTWNGLRLSLDKNIDQAGVTWDDSNLKTALYGFGKMKSNAPLDFGSVVWTTTVDHPAKPAGQKYIEDPDATTEYGRNGRPRFGYYQNGDISDKNILLEKTWETLKTVRVPKVSIDSTVKNLLKMGMPDVPIRLHDTALVEILPTNVTLENEVIRYTEDLLNPLNDRVNIGEYIPNIIYINRKNGGGGGGSGGQENKWYRFQYDIDTQEGDLQSKIALVVTENDGQNVVNIASIVLALNSSGSSVIIDADKVDINGYLVAHTVQVDGLSSTKNILSQGWVVAGTYVNAGTDVQINSVSLKSAITSFGTATASGGQITIPTTTFGGTAGPSINFNIADTQFYIDGVAAAYDQGWNDCRDACVSGTYYTGTVRQLYDPDNDVYVNAVNPYSTVTRYTIPSPRT